MHIRRKKKFLQKIALSAIVYLKKALTRSYTFGLLLKYLNFIIYTPNDHKAIEPAAAAARSIAEFMCAFLST